MTAIYILGALPPPLGGVSVYCLRKYKMLQAEGVQVRFFDTRQRSSLFTLVIACWIQILRRKVFELEINISSPTAILLLSFCGIGRHTVFFDHNGSRRFKESPILLAVFRRFCRSLKAIKVVNPDLLGLYEALGSDILRKTVVDTPFIKPLAAEVEDAKAAFAGPHAALLEAGRNIILCSAWRPINSDKEPDLYGLRDALKIYQNLLPSFREHRFVLMIGELGTDPLSVEMIASCSELKRYENFFFISGGVAQWPLLENTKVLLRLTKTDGDSVSVREALAFGAEVVATDVCWRPTDVCVVPLGDIGAAEREVARRLQHVPGRQLEPLQK